MSRNANGSSGICKNVLKLEDVNSAEFDETTKNPVIHIMEEQKGIDKKVEQCVWELIHVC